jgi:DNA-binding NarL/FixJ family response regulator
VAAVGAGVSAVRIVVVDDHPIVRDGLRALFDTVDDVELVGEAADADGALREVTLARPDVVLLDVHLPGGGLTALAGIRRASPATAALMLTMADDAETVLESLRLGAAGYLVKGANQAEILRAVRAVHDGQLILGQQVDRHVRGLSAAGTGGPFHELAARERQILDLVAAGLGNAAIADRLALSPKTVANYLTSVFAKLAVSDRSQAIVKARDAGLGRG